MLLSTRNGSPGFIFIDPPMRRRRLQENSMSNVSNADTHNVPLSTNKARGGVTGHHVRYVLGFGLAGIIGAFVIISVLYGFGS